jgi:hypothetical protein
MAVRCRDDKGYDSDNEICVAMSLADLGAVGEFLGFFAVVLTLIYLARQLRQNTASSRVASSWAMMASFNQAHSEIFSRPETAALILKTLREEGLDEVEQIRINSLCLSHINALLVTHEAHATGQISDAMWQREVTDSAFLTSPGLRPFLLIHLRIVPREFTVDVFGEEIADEAARAPEAMAALPRSRGGEPRL